MSESIPETKSKKSPWLSTPFLGFSLFFIVWVCLLDSNSLLIIWNLEKEIEEARTTANYFKAEYKRNQITYDYLTKNRSAKEIYARENYFMKKSDEEIFILVIDSSQMSREEIDHLTEKDREIKD